MILQVLRREGAILGLMLLAASCSNTQLTSSAKKETTEKPDQDKESEKEKANGLQSEASDSDIPTWVNASHLTCSWDAASTAEELGVLCDVADAENNYPKPNPWFPLSWSAIHEQDGEESLPSEVNPSGDRMGALFHFAKNRVAMQSIRWTLNEAGFVPREESLRKLLPGLGQGSELETCLSESASARACLTPYLKENVEAAPPGRSEFSFTGADQQFTVPEGVSSITVKVWGAGGGRGTDLGTKSGIGGGGGYASAKLTVTPGEILTVIVGGGGKTHAAGGGSGGGRSAIKRAQTEILTAGGGGGGGSGFAGPLAPDTSMYGGLAGGVHATQDQAKNGGSGHPQGAGAAGCQSSLCGKAGAQFQGGAGYCGGGAASYGGGGEGGASPVGPCGGGGGGGYFGGGGGGQSYGGGGGASFVPSGGTSLAGQGAVPGNAADSERGSAGEGAIENEAKGGKVSLQW